MLPFSLANQVRLPRFYLLYLFYFNRSQFVPVVRILRAICRWVRGSACLSLVHALCRRCSDVFTSCSGLGLERYHSCLV